MFSRARSAALLLLQKISRPSAQRTNLCPLFPSSLSHSFSMIFPHSELNGPPRGTSSGLSPNIPSARIPARRNLWIRKITRPSFIVSDRIYTSLLWLTVSIFQIYVRNIGVTVCYVRLASSQGLVSTSFWPKAKAVSEN